MKGSIVLKEAKALIQANWIKGSAKRQVAPGIYAYCLVGAKDEAAAKFPLGECSTPDCAFCVAEKPLLEALRKRLNDEKILRSQLVTYNDDQRTKHEDILSLLDDAIKIAEASE
jgi:thiol-disulfide isomerase/thioredoxin